MDKAYKNKFVFVNDQAPELDADNLNKISNAIDVIDDRVIDLDTNKANKNNPDTTGSWTHNGDAFITGNLRHYEGESLLHNLNVNSIDHYGEPIEFKQEINYKQNDVELDNAFGQIIDNRSAIEDLESKPASAMVMEGENLLTYATNNNIVGLYAEGKSEQKTSGVLKTVQGGLNVTNNPINQNVVSLNYRCVSDLLFVKSGGIISVSSGYQIYVCTSDTANGNIESGADWVTNKVITSDKYVRILVRNASNTQGVITPSEFTLTAEGLAPTPSTPIAIKDASGVVEAHTQNLFDINGKLNYKRDGSEEQGANIKTVKVSDTELSINAVGANSYGVGQIIDAKVNGDYTVSFIVGSLGNGTGITCRIYDISDYNTPIAQKAINTLGSATLTANLNSGKKYLIGWYVSGGTSPANGRINNVMFEQGTSASPYVEYKSNAIAITEAENLMVPNLTSRTVNGITITNNNGIYTLNGTSTGAINEAVNSNFSALESGRYIFSLCDNSNVVARVVQDINGSRTEHALTPKRAIFDTTNNATYLMQIHINSGVTLSNVVVNPKVEKCIVLRNIPNTNIADTVTVSEDGSGEWVQNVGLRYLATINGTWTRYTDTNKPVFYVTASTSYLLDANAASMCDKLQSGQELNSFDDCYNRGNYSVSLRYGLGRIVIRNDDCKTSDELVNWLKAINPIMYYPLQKPIVTTLTKEQVRAIRQLKTYEGTTLIDAELQNVYVIYAGDIKKYVDEKVGDAVLVALDLAEITAKSAVNRVTFYGQSESEVGEWREGFNELILYRKVLKGTVAQSATTSDGQEVEWLTQKEIKMVSGHVGMYPIQRYVSDTNYFRVDWFSLMVDPDWRPVPVVNIHCSNNYVGMNYEIVVYYTKPYENTVTPYSLDDSAIPNTENPTALEPTPTLIAEDEVDK